MKEYGNENLGAFQPTRPLRGATNDGTKSTKAEKGFQPTRPLRGATLTSVFVSSVPRFQPTRPLRGATAQMTADAESC